MCKVCVCLCLALALVGCVTRLEYGGENPEIIVASNGAITAFGQSTTINAIAPIVKSIHLERDYQVRVMLHTTKGEDLEIMNAISREMMKANHPGFYFQRPKRALSVHGDARTQLDDQMLQQPTNAKPKN